MQRIVVGRLKFATKTSNAENADDGLMAQAEAIFANADEVLANTGYTELVPA